MGAMMQARVTSDGIVYGYIRSDADSDRERKDPDNAKCQKFVVEFSMNTYVFRMCIHAVYRWILIDSNPW